MNGPYKRFIVLMDEMYYPAACMGSVVGSFDSFEEALEKAKTKAHGTYLTADYVQVFDCDERRVVWEEE